MPHATDIQLLAAKRTAERIAYRTPMKFGGRVVTDVVLLNVCITVETGDGRGARGFGSMPMGNAWAWPSAQLSSDLTLTAMLAFGERAVAEANRLSAAGHPLEITRALSDSHSEIAEQIEGDFSLEEPIPRLAQLVAASPLEAAIHDAYGRALGANSYNLLGPEYANHDLESELGPEFAGEYLDRYTLREPKAKMPLYHLVGALDPLSDGDISRRVDDGLPETLIEWIVANGLTHLKIKLAGDDLQWDIERVTSVESVCREAQSHRKCSQWHYSLDFNEKCSSVEYVLDFLHQVREKSPAAYDRVQYIEQPTHRNLREFPQNRMHEAARLKPVVIDESLVDLDSLHVAREMGYSGVALKACKGHSEALLMAAAAQKYGMFLCVQDLTCPGMSFLHSASLAARIPGIAAIEGNGRQFCPAGNDEWRGRYPSMFDITDGTVGTAALSGVGLGYAD